MKKPKMEKDKSERWMLTYSDLMNLLLILFIILYCSSEVSAQKAEALAISIREGFGQYAALSDGDSSGSSSGSGGGSADSGGTGESDQEYNPTNDGLLGQYGASAEDQQYDQFYQDVASLLKESGLEAKVTVVMSQRGVVISFKDNVLFPSGSANLGSEANTLITTLGGMLKKLTYSSIIVEGHTDSVPIHTARFQDNMDLSTQRAANVWRNLVACGLPPSKMSSIGYGEYRPVAPNDTAENKAKNRRVVISILRKTTDAEDELLSGSTGGTYVTGQRTTQDAAASPTGGTSGG